MANMFDDPSEAPAAPGNMFDDDTSSSPFGFPQRPAPPPPPPPGDFSAGFQTALGQTPALIKGAVGLGAATIENLFGSGGMATGVKNWALDGFQRDMAEVAKLQQENHDVTVAWAKAKEGDIGALVDFVQYAAGYGLAQIGESALAMLAGSVVGGALGGAAAPATAAAGAAAGAVKKGLVKEWAESWVTNAVAKQVAESGGKLTVKQAAKQLGSKWGGTQALMGWATVQETGAIYPEAVEQIEGVEGREMNGYDIARVWGFGIAAGLLEGGADKLQLDAILGRNKYLKAAFGKLGVMKRTAIGGGIGLIVEPGTELGQTYLEQLGAQKDPFSDEAKHEYINAMAMAAVPGLGAGMVGGAMSRQRPAPPPAPTGELSAGEVYNEIGRAGSVDEAIMIAGALTETGLPMTEGQLLSDRALMAKTAEEMQTVLRDRDWNAIQGAQAAQAGAQASVASDARERRLGAVEEAQRGIGQEQMLGARSEEQLDLEMAAANAAGMNEPAPQTAMGLAMERELGRLSARLMEGNPTQLRTTQLEMLAAKAPDPAVRQRAIETVSARRNADAATLAEAQSTEANRSALEQTNAPNDMPFSRPRELAASQPMQAPTVTGAVAPGPENDAAAVQRLNGALAAESQRAGQPASPDWQTVDVATLPVDDTPMPGSPVNAMARSQESVRLAQGFVGLFGKRMVPIRNLSAREGDFMGGTVISDDGERVFVNVDSPDASPIVIAGHELGHLMDRDAPDLALKVRQAIGLEGKQEITAEHPLVGFYRYYQGGANLTDEQVAAELTKPAVLEMMKREIASDFLGNRAGEYKTLQTVFKAVAGSEDTGLIYKVADYIVKFIDSILRRLKTQKFEVSDALVAKLVKDLEGAKQVARDALAEYAKRQGLTKMQAEAAMREALVSKAKAAAQPKPRLDKNQIPILSKQRTEWKKGPMGLGATVNGERALVRRVVMGDGTYQYQALVAGAAVGTAKTEAAAQALAEQRIDELSKSKQREAFAFRTSPDQMRAVGLQEGMEALLATELIHGPAPEKIGGIPAIVNMLEQRALAVLGRKLDLTDANDRETAAALMAVEANEAYSRSGNASEWYDATIRKLMRYAALKHEELGRDPNMRTAFTLAMAITSQGQDVFSNIRFADQQYVSFKETGRFPILGWGTSKSQMEKNFRLINGLLDAEMTLPQIRQFLATPFTAGELKRVGFAVSELLDEQVLGSSIFGPKIGFGFYSNLNGNFEPVTMDMWFMRLIGRLTGTLKAYDERKIAKQVARLRDAIADTSTPDKPQLTTTDVDADPALVNGSEDDVLEYALAVVAAHEKDYRDNETEFKRKTRVKSELVLASESLKESFLSPTDAPGSGGERRNLRDVVRRAVSKLETLTGRRLPPASMQAIVWYPEQRLYSRLGAKLRVTEQDYASGMREVLRNEGYTDEQLDAAQRGAVAARSGNGEEVARRNRDARQAARRPVPLEEGQRAEVALAIAEKLNDIQPDSIYFEVAPSPADVAVKAQWDALPMRERMRISDKVARYIIPKAASAIGALVRIRPQLGGWMGDTNPSFTLDYLGNAKDFLPFTGLLGYALSQQAMVSVSHKSFKGATEMGAVTIDLTDPSPRAVAALYKKLWNKAVVDGKKIVVGHTTVGNQMAILNTSRLSTEDFATLIHDSLDGKYEVHQDVVFAKFSDAPEYDYGRSQKSGGAARRASLQGDARSLHAEVEQLIRAELGRQPAPRLAKSAVRSSGGGNERTGSWSKRAPQPAAVEVDAWHYGQERVPALSGRMYGRGIKGEEAKRLAVATDPRIKRRIYFYIGRDTGQAPNKEGGLGPHKYEATLGNMFDPRVGDPRIAAPVDPNLWESSILDAGYDGYVNRSKGMAVVLDADVPATYVGVDYAGPKVATPAPVAPSLLKQPLMSAEIGPVTAAIAGIPGARVRMGTLEVAQASVQQVNAALSSAGLGVQMSKQRDAAERFNTEQVESNRVPNWKGREKLVQMPLDQFLALSEDGTDETKAKRVAGIMERGEQFETLPYMIVESDGRVTGHEGRHRARWLLANGYTTMPVVLKSANIRWSEQADPNRFDYIDDKDWPKTLRAQKGAPDERYTAPFPVAREDAMQPYPSEPGISKSTARTDITKSAQRGGITGTSAFKRWSKGLPVVNIRDKHTFRTGEGLILSGMLHGSPRAKSLRAFREGEIGTGRFGSASNNRLGWHFTDNAAQGAEYALMVDAYDMSEREQARFERVADGEMLRSGEGVVETFIRLEKPLVMAGRQYGRFIEGKSEDVSALRVFMQDNEHDGVIVDWSNNGARSTLAASYMAVYDEMLDRWIDKYNALSKKDKTEVRNAEAEFLAWADGGASSEYPAAAIDTLVDKLTDGTNPFIGRYRASPVGEDVLEYLGLSVGVRESLHNPFFAGTEGSLWVVVTPEAADRGQIKSVLNNGKFTDSPDIYKSAPRWGGFYSELAKQVDALPTNSSVATGWKQAIKSLTQKGVKVDEIEWSGVNEWLDLQPAKVTKQQVLDYLAQNGPTTIETLKSPPNLLAEELEWDSLDVRDVDDPLPVATSFPSVRPDRIFEAKRDNGQFARYEWDSVDVGDEDDTVFEPHTVVEYFPDGETPWLVYSGPPERMNEEIGRFIGGRFAREKGGLPKFSKYTVTGGNDYRELLIRLPSKVDADGLPAGYQVIDEGDGRWSFKTPTRSSRIFTSREDAVSGALHAMRRERENGDGIRNDFTYPAHWEEPNVVAHVRFKERMDAAGARVLFIEEGQSDWAQQGGEEGFVNPAIKETRQAMYDRVLDAQYRVEEIKDSFSLTSDDNELTKLELAYAEAREEEIAARREWEEFSGRAGEIPLAPFVAKREFAVFKDGVEVKAAKDGRTQRYGTMEEAQAAAKRLGGEARDLGYGENTPAWVSLMLKRMIGWAVENGFDKIAWATGAQSAEHYKLEKHVSKLEWMENEKKLFGYDPKTEMMTVSEAEVTREKLPKYIGKELAERLAGQKKDTFGVRTLEGDGLVVGGEGMKTFYDSVLPNIANEVLRKLKAETKVGVIEVMPDRPVTTLSVIEVDPSNDPEAGQSLIAETDEIEGARFFVVNENGYRLANAATREKAEAELKRRQRQLSAKFVGPQLGFEITPQLKAAAERGLPLFSKQRWFEGSKAVDANGEPLVLYHSTASDVDAFKTNFGEDEYRRFGAHLGSIEAAENRIGIKAAEDEVNGERGGNAGVNVMPLHLRAKNPLRLDENRTGRWGVDDIMRAVIEKAEAGDLPEIPADSKFVDDYYEDASRLGGKRSKVWQDVNDWRPGERSDALRTWLESLGYDSIVYANEFEGGGDSYIAFRPEQIKSAIGNEGTFDPKDARITKSADRSQFLGALTPAQEAALRTAGAIVQPKTWQERWATYKTGLGQRAIQGIFDQFDPIKHLDQEAYMQARMSRGSDGTLEAALLYGRPKLVDGVPNVDINDRGFANVLADLGADTDRFFWWVAAKRAQRLKAEGRENLLTDQDITALLTLNEPVATDPATAGRAARFSRALAELNEFNEAILRIALESDLIDKDGYNLFKDQPYVPFYRVMEEEGGIRGPGFGGGLTSQYMSKKLKGGSEALNQDLLANVLLNWSHVLSASAKNRAAVATMGAAMQVGAVLQVPASTPKSVRIRVEGKEQHFLVHDPYLLEAISAIEYATPRWFKPFSTVKRWLTIGVTASPSFKIRNLIRDSVQAIATGQLKPNPIGNVAQGFKASAKSTQTYASMLASGGMIRFGSLVEGDRAHHVQRLIDKAGRKAHILDEPSWKKLQGQMVTLIEAYNELGDRSENVNRNALYEQLRAKGVSHLEAAFMARDLMDFAMGGTWPVVRFLTQSVPFLNARLQGLYKLGRSAKDDPARVGYVVGAVALASLALLLMYGDDEDWKKREDWDRDTYWWFKIGDVAYRIPKPFEIGAIGTIAERTWELMFDKEMTGKRYGRRTLEIITEQFAMNPVPQIVKPMIDLYANRDSFTGRAIESMGMERRRPEDRARASTSTIALALGQLGLPNPAQLANARYEALSPVQIDHLVRGYFGWLGTAITAGLDYGLRPMSDRGARPEMRLKDVFLAGSFVETLPANSSRYVTEMYEQARQAQQFWASYRDAVKFGDTARAAELMAENREQLVKARRLSGFTDAGGQLNGQVRRIEASRSLSPETKRKMIDALEQRRNQLAMRAVAP